MKYITPIIFSILFGTATYAEPIRLLQQRANSAYEKMMQAKHKAQHAAQDANDATQQLQHIQKQLQEAEQKASNTKAILKTAQQNLTEATTRWNNASDALAQQWRDSK